MKNRINSCLLFFILFLFICHISSAQYNGGEGEGSEKSSTIQLTLNGNPINTIAMYLGGQNDGHDKHSTSTTLAGGEIQALYQGGNNDGSHKSYFAGTLEGSLIANLYLGGDGDGHHKDYFSGVLDGAEIAQLYSGGIGDGHHKVDFSGLLDGSLIAQLYLGGEGDGHSKSLFIGVLDGAELNQLYSGGSGDGHDKNMFVGILDGSMLSALYSGGSGDGFSKHMIQYIFDFPGCTFVVNTDDNGFGSLRYAIDCAAPGDTIEFSPLLMQDSIVLTSANLEITKDIFIDGDKSAELTVDASQVDRALKTGAYNVTIKGLRIIVGTESNGGAVLNGGILTLMDVDIYDPTNSAVSVIQTTISGSLRIKGTVTVQEN